MSGLKKVETVAVDIADAVLNVTIAFGTNVGEAVFGDATSTEAVSISGGADISVGVKASNKEDKSDD